MGFEVERLEEWIGQDVVDPDGQKAGKLEEIYLSGDEPLVAEVKEGGLRRKTRLVPLEGATVGRGHVRVRHAASLIGSAPGGGAGAEVSILDLVAGHYGLGTWSGGALEGSKPRAERLAAAAEAEERAAQLEEEARRREAEAQESGRASQEADEARARAEADARAAREEAERARGGGAG